jgi:hypothetical protein
LNPQRIPQLLKLPFLTTKPLGVIFLLLVTGYFFLTLTYKKPIKIGQENIYLPCLESFPGFDFVDFYRLDISR